VEFKRNYGIYKRKRNYIQKTKKYVYIKIVKPSILFGLICTFQMNTSSHLKMDSNLNSTN
jgi:hypothetical protein